MKRATWIALGAIACGDPAAPTGLGRVQIALIGTSDTVRFAVPVIAAPCGGGTGLLLHGEQRGQGVLVWLRDAGGSRPDTGSYPLLTRGDTVAPRGVIASIRYLVGDIAHGVTLDNGAARVARSAPPLALQIRGRGVETAVAGQRSAEVVLEDVTLAPDSVTCRPGP